MVIHWYFRKTLVSLYCNLKFGPKCAESEVAIKGVFWTTSDRDRIAFCWLWIPHGYSKKIMEIHFKNNLSYNKNTTKISYTRQEVVRSLFCLVTWKNLFVYVIDISWVSKELSKVKALFLGRGKIKVPFVQCNIIYYTTIEYNNLQYSTILYSTLK